MKLQDICISLEIAKELKEAGYPQKTLFNWINNHNKYLLVSFNGQEEMFSAPTASELCEELPNYISKGADGFYLHIAKLNEEKDKFRFEIFYKPAKNNPITTYENLHNIRENSLQDALGKMWIFLKKEELL